MTERLEIFLACPPGLEPALRDEALALGFLHPKIVPGGVTFPGKWEHVWRANLCSRGANRVLVRIAQFEAPTMAALEQGAKAIHWAPFLRRGTSVRIDASAKKSKIIHTGAIEERVAHGITAAGASIDSEGDLRVSVRIEKDLCTVSVDTSGDLLYRRGFKQAVNKAPLRETLASLFLRQCGFDGTEPVLDPMCGSGTIPIEAAEWSLGLLPGRKRHFAFQDFAAHDEAAWQALKADLVAKAAQRAVDKPPIHLGFDRDAGAIQMSTENAVRAGVEDHTAFGVQSVSQLKRPYGPTGLILVNPPYGERLGSADKLKPAYRSLGQALKNGMQGWRVGLITSDASLAHATELPFEPPGPPIPHGPIRIQLYRTEPLSL